MIVTPDTLNEWHMFASEIDQMMASIPEIGVCFVSNVVYKGRYIWIPQKPELVGDISSVWEYILTKNNVCGQLCLCSKDASEQSLWERLPLIKLD